MAFLLERFGQMVRLAGQWWGARPLLAGGLALVWLIAAPALSPDPAPPSSAHSTSRVSTESGRESPALSHQGRFPVLSTAEAWKRLPPAETGSGKPLPAWARALAG